MKNLLVIFLQLLSIAIGVGVAVLLADHTDLSAVVVTTITVIIIFVCWIIVSKTVGLSNDAKKERKRFIMLCDNCLNIKPTKGSDVTAEELTEEQFYDGLNELVAKPVMLLAMYKSVCNSCKIKTKNYFNAWCSEVGVDLNESFLTDEEQVAKKDEYHMYSTESDMIFGEEFTPKIARGDVNAIISLVHGLYNGKTISDKKTQVLVVCAILSHEEKLHA